MRYTFCMQDGSQIFIPDSFIALHQGRNHKLLTPLTEVAARYELCEDLANHLTEHAQRLYHGDAAPSEADILGRMHAGLLNAESGVSADEARWVTQRLGELLQWPLPDWPD